MISVFHPPGNAYLRHRLNRICIVIFSEGFLTDDLSLTDNQKQRKYFGVCVLPGEDRKVKRLVFLRFTGNNFSHLFMDDFCHGLNFNLGKKN